MKSTFLVEIDHGSDTDLAGIAFDMQEALQVSTFPYETLSVKPWTHPTLQQASPLQLPATPPDAPAN